MIQCNYICINNIIPQWCDVWFRRISSKALSDDHVVCDLTEVQDGGHLRKLPKRVTCLLTCQARNYFHSNDVITFCAEPCLSIVSIYLVSTWHCVVANLAFAKWCRISDAASLSLASCQRIKMYLHVFCFLFFSYRILIEKRCSHRTEGSPGSPTPAAFQKPLSASRSVARLIWSAKVRN